MRRVVGLDAVVGSREADQGATRTVSTEGKGGGMSLMGVDIGSSRCKVVVFTSTGEVIAEAVANYTPNLPGPSMAEIDPDVLWRAVALAMRTASSEVEHDPVRAVGLSSHGETFVPTNDQGEAIAPAILNVDSRANEEAAWWESCLGRESLFHITGLVVHPMYPMAKIQWMRTHEPELFASTSRFVSISDYILLRLGLPPFIAYSLASRFMAFDVRELRWSEGILGIAGLTGDRLPIPVPAGTTAGRLSRTVAAELGLSPDVPVVVGGHDQPCGALGMGAIVPGMVTNSLGTYECLVCVTDQPSLDEASLAASLNSYCHVVPGQYITIAYFPAGIMVKWFCDTFCGEDASEARAEGLDLHEYLERMAPQGPTGLCVAPHLIGSGNPYFDPRATGVVVGLNQSTNRYHIYKGCLEGIACELANVVNVLADVVGPFDTIRCTGGGAKSRLGLQLRAAIAGRRMQTLRHGEAVCLGAALLAGVSVGTYGSLQEAVERVVEVEETIEPEHELAEAYDKQIRQYRLLYPALAPLREL